MNWLKKLWKRFRYGIALDGNLYLVRYRLLWLPWIGHIYLHHILRTDNDREPHDHPFDFTSIVIWNSYVEHLFEQEDTSLWCTTEIRSLFSVARRKATQLHRVELDNGPVWTLFIRGEKYREWGFQTRVGWVKWSLFDYYKKTIKTLDKKVERKEIAWYEVRFNCDTGMMSAVVEVVPSGDIDRLVFDPEEKHV